MGDGLGVVGLQAGQAALRQGQVTGCGLAFLDAPGHLVFEADVLGLSHRVRRLFTVGAEPVAISLDDTQGELLLGIGHIGDCALGVGLGARNAGFDAPASPQGLVQAQDGDAFIAAVAGVAAVRGGVLD